MSLEAGGSPVAGAGGGPHLELGLVSPFPVFISVCAQSAVASFSSILSAFISTESGWNFIFVTFIYLLGVCSLFPVHMWRSEDK